MIISEGKRHDVMDALGTVARVADDLRAKISPNGSGGEHADEIRKQMLHIAARARAERTNIDEPFRLGVIGMFKAGKSSVINTWLGKPVLVEGRVETTAVLTELRFATDGRESATIRFRDGREQTNVLLDDALKLTDLRSDAYRGLDTDGLSRKQDSIERIVLYLQSDFLRTVTLLDTPGFGGSIAGDAQAFAALEKVDAAVLIFSADRVGSKNELEVADWLSRKSREVVAVLNKTDDGSGRARAETDVSSVETFIRDNFRTLAADAQGRPLIFRYSAAEVAKALRLREAPGSSDAQKRAAEEQLVRWGYSGSGDADAEKGVIAFVRDRYFSSGAATAYRRKLDAARNAVVNEIEATLHGLDAARQTAEENEEKAKGKKSARQQQLDNEINPKIDYIESEIATIVEARVQTFVRELEAALELMIANQETLDFSDLALVFRDQEAIAAELRDEFRALFPPSRERLMMDDIEHQLVRLMRNQWMYVFDQVRKLDTNVVLPDTTKFFEAIHKALREVVLAILAKIGGWIVASVFFPGSGIAITVIELGTDALLAHTGGRHKKRLTQARQRIKVMLQNYATELSASITRGARDANDELARQARVAVREELDAIGTKAEAEHALGEQWRQMHRDLQQQRAMLKRLEIAIQ